MILSDNNEKNKHKNKNVVDKASKITQNHL